jgi:hypothetical protein
MVAVLELHRSGSWAGRYPASCELTANPVRHLRHRRRPCRPLLADLATVARNHLTAQIHAREWNGHAGSVRCDSYGKAFRAVDGDGAQGDGRAALLDPAHPVEEFREKNPHFSPG